MRAVSAEEKASAYEANIPQIDLFNSSQETFIYKVAN